MVRAHEQWWKKYMYSINLSMRTSCRILKAADALVLYVPTPRYALKRSSRRNRAAEVVVREIPASKTQGGHDTKRAEDNWNAENT